MQMQHVRSMWIPDVHLGSRHVNSTFLLHLLQLNIPGTKYVVGDGPQLEKLKKKYPDIHFTGYNRGFDLARHVSSADVFVFPSKSDTLGNVMLEAMSSGVPVAAYKVAGPLQVIQDGITGCLSDNLEHAFYRALKIEPMACRKYAQNFSWNSCTRQFFANLNLLPKTYYGKTSIEIQINKPYYSSRSPRISMHTFIANKKP